MNLMFVTTAAEAFVSKAEKAESVGQIKSAVSYYENAIKQYSNAIQIDSTNADRYKNLIDKCRESIKQLEKGCTNQQAKSDVLYDQNRFYASCDIKNITPVETACYSQYDLEFSLPDEAVTFDDIIGLSDAKMAIRKKLIYPLSAPEIYQNYGLKAGGNILLEGPPGTGKTSFAKAVACEIKLPFVKVDCNALVDYLIGNTGKNIDKLFIELRRFVKEQNAAVVVFFDEFDAIAKMRTSDDKTSAEAVPSLIRQLDGFDTNNDNIVIIAATNLKNLLDPAIRSRFTNSILIPLPNMDERFLILKNKLIRSGISNDDLNALNLREAALKSDGMSGRLLTHITKELIEVLAERDSGITKLDAPLQTLFINIIDHKRIELS